MRKAATRREPSPEVILCFGVLFIAAALPLYFEIYRSAYYKTFSYDDYAQFLLLVMGKAGGVFPPSPHVYRIGSVIVAAPLFYLPPLSFSGEGIFHAPVSMSENYMRAMQAMCMANMISVTLAALAVARYARTKLRLSMEWSFIAAITLLLLSRYLGMTSADGIAAFPLVLVILAAAERRLLLFALSVAAGVFINEKIALVALFMVGSRALFHARYRRANAWMTLSAGLVLAGFVLAVVILHFPGLENQRSPSTYGPAMIAMVRDLFSLQGLYQNLWPVLLLLFLWRIGTLAPRERRFLQVADIGVIAAMFVMALALDVKYNVGRIVIYAAPLFLIGAIQALAGRTRDAGARTRAAPDLSLALPKRMISQSVIPKGDLAGTIRG